MPFSSDTFNKIFGFADTIKPTPSSSGAVNPSSFDTELDRLLSMEKGETEDSWLDSSGVWKLFDYIKYQAGGDSDAKIALAQLILQYILGEQNYDRSKASNQVAQMMAAGMSRAAALQALQGGSNPSTSVSPLQTSIGSNRAANLNAISGMVQTAAQAVGVLGSLVTLPFDIHNKRLTGSIMTNQNALMEMQMQGMQAAAAFSQAVYNADASGASIGALPLSEQYAYFGKQSRMQPSDDGYNMSAAAYGSSSAFRDAFGNPYFWATLANNRDAVNRANASVFEPERMKATIQHMRAAAGLSDAQAMLVPIQSRILNSQAFVDENTQRFKVIMQESEAYISQVNADSAQIESDARAAAAIYNKEYYSNMLDILPTITAATLEEYSYRLGYLETLHDPELFESERQKLVSSNTYDSYVYTKLSMIEAFKQQELENMIGSSADPDKIQTYSSMVQEGIKLIDLYGNDIDANKRGWLDSMCRGIGIGVGAGVGAYQILRKSPAPAPTPYAPPTATSSTIPMTIYQ